MVPPQPLDERLDERLETLSVLADPVRRRVFLHVVDVDEPVSRYAAAAALGISRPLAAFHLDRLQAAGLLEAEFRRPADRPARGRPTKLYRLTDRELDVSVPARRYELAATLFVDALASIDRPAALDEAARAEGRSLGVEARRRAGSRARRERIVEAIEGVLREAGYAPRRSGTGELFLGNCPFRSLAERQRELVCGTNRSLIEGALAGARTDGLEACLDPAPGRCCVVIREARSEPVQEAPRAR